MISFFSAQLDYIFFFYGLSFLFLYAVCFVLDRSANRLMPWRSFGYFGLVHSLNEWLDLVAVGFGDSLAFKLVRFSLLLLSFIFLFEFGRKYFGGRSAFLSGPLAYPALLLPVAGAAAYSFPAAVTATRILPGFFGGLIAAAALADAGKRDAQGSGRRLVPASYVLAAYAVASGLIVQKTALFPFSVVNQEAFFEFSGIPVQFVRGLLACLLTALFWNYFNAQRFGYNREVYTANSSHMKLGLRALVLTLIAGWAMTNYVGEEARKSLRDESETETILLTSMVAEYLSDSESAIRTLVAIRSLSDALRKRDPDSVAEANKTLDSYSGAISETVCYLMDTAGVVIASSNRGQPDSFLGKNYSFRPYFKNAVESGYATYFTRGVTSKKRGYYVSSAIRESDRCVGVVVVKRNIDEVEKDFYRYQRCYMIDPNGVIFAASDQNAIFSMLWGATGPAKKRIAEAGQFENVVFDHPVLEREPVNREFIVSLGEKYYVTRRTLNESGWTTVIFHQTTMISAYRLFSIVIVCTLSLLILSSVTWIQLIEEANFINFMEQRRAGEALKRREEHFRALIENTSDIIFIVRPDGRISYASNSLERVLGYKNAEVTGTDLFGLVHPEDIASIRSIFEAKVLNSPEKTIVSTCRFRNREGNYIYIENVFKNLVDFGPVGGITVNSRDVTERKRAEEEYLRESKLEALGVLAGGIAHDFNNILMSIVTNIGLVKKRLSSDDKNVEILKRAEEASYKAKNLTSQFITFARGGAPVKKPVDVTTVLRSTSALAVGGTRTRVELSCAEGLLCMADETQLGQVFTNIFINAVQAMPEGGLIEVSTELVSIEEPNLILLPGGPYVRISIIDNGPGIPDNILNRIFDPYFTTKPDGNGLGLASAYSIIRNHSGAMTAGRARGGGASFNIYLPALPGPAGPVAGGDAS